LHISQIPVFYAIFESLSKSLVEVLVPQFVELLMNSIERTENWLNCAFQVARNLRSRPEVAEYSQYALGDGERELSDIARNSIATIGLTPEEGSALILQFLTDPPTEDGLSLISRIVGDIVLKDDSLRERLMQFVLYFLTAGKNLGAVFQLILDLALKQRFELSDDVITKLFASEGNEREILELIKKDGLKPEAIERQLLSETNIDRSKLRFVEEYIHKQNDISEGVRHLPFVGEELLWNFVMRPSEINNGVAHILCRLYMDNDQAVLPSRRMIETFFAQWESHFRNRSSSKKELFALLSKFVMDIDKCIDMYISDWPLVT
jgi:hypothetical protein